MLQLIELSRPGGEIGATMTLPYEQRRKSRQRLRLDDGREAALVLPRGTVLRDGDVLRSAEGVAVQVRAAREPVSTALAPSPRLMARACYHLGNRHVALQVGDGWLRYQSDHVLDAMLRELGLEVVAEQAPFEPEGGACPRHARTAYPSPALSAGGGGAVGPAAPDRRATLPGRVRVLTRCRGTAPPVAGAPERAAALLPLMRLSSPMLPVGAYAYSQGLEYAVAAGWIRSEAEALEWITGLLEGALAGLDAPVVKRLHEAWGRDDVSAVEAWNHFLYAARESAELRAEDRQLGAALARLLAELGETRAQPWRCREEVTFAALFALAAVAWRIPVRQALYGYLWAWCENQVAAAIKLIPLGQTAGQRILGRAVEVIPAAVESALALADEEVGFTAQALGIASARHETQYTRLFRS